MDQTELLASETVLKKESRQMRKWIIPCNIKNYDVIGAFSHLKRLNWKQSTHIEVGDTVYIYTAKPYSRVTHKCRAIEVNLNHRYIDDTMHMFDASPYKNHGRYMTLELIDHVHGAGLDWLKKKGISGNIQGPRTIDFEI
jgi:5-methylcytosine-specific restriction enzyme A